MYTSLSVKKIKGKYLTEKEREREERVRSVTYLTEKETESVLDV